MIPPLCCGWVVARKRGSHIQLTHLTKQGRATVLHQMVESVYRYRSQVDDKLRREWTEAVLGVEYVADPATGDVWKVPGCSRHYWRRGWEIYGTESSNPPWPDPEFVEPLPTP